MSNRQRDILSIVVVFSLVVGALYLVMTSPPKLGLDLRGGMNIVLTAKATKNAPVTEDSIEQAQLIIAERVNALGVAEPQIERLIGTPNIVVQLPGVKDAKKALDVIGKTAQLEFREVVSNKPAFTVGTAEKKEKVKLGPDEFYSKDRQTIYKLGPVVLTGKALQSSAVGFDNLQRPKVDMVFTTEGAIQFEKITGSMVGKQLAIVLDGTVMSSPVVQAQISGGQADITGKFELSEVKDLVLVLNTGALPVNLSVTQQQVIGPSLGQESLDAGLRAGIIGLVLVALFLLVSYRGLGLISLVGLSIFAALYAGVLTSIDATLTLPGIAGIIMAIGLASDSSIVYFERFKEEVAKGKTSRSAASQGFSFAWRTIIDADSISLIIAVVLIALSYFYFGVGPVRGFAFTLSLGTLTDIFTAFFFTKPTLRLLAEFSIFRNPAFIGAKKVS